MVYFSESSKHFLEVFYVHFTGWRTQILNLYLRAHREQVVGVGFEPRDHRVHAFSCFAEMHLAIKNRLELMPSWLTRCKTTALSVCLVPDAA